jgi:hypothetical protein
MNRRYLLIIFVISAFLFAKDKNFTVKEQISIMQNNGSRPVLIEDENNSLLPNSREEITLWMDDFEEDLGWTTDAGWQLTSEDSYSPTNSMNSPNDATTLNGTWDLLSPNIDLPPLGEGETMNFGFHLSVGMPDSDGDADDYLEDYYTISLMDTDALAWHESSSGSFDGNSYWCGDEEIGGYLDSWIQFLDTPAFTVPAGGAMTADMKWAIELQAGAAITGSCTDGWDAANVRISADGGNSWELLTGNVPYDFDCGYGWIWNDPEYDTGGSLNNLAAGWGNISDWQNISFDLAAYEGQDVIVRFAFGSDPAYSTLDDNTITGFYVDNVAVSGSLDCNPENECMVSASGQVWVDQFYDYYSVDEGYVRPGSNGWEEYLPGLAFNGNVFLDISDFAEKTVIFRVQSRYDENDDGGAGSGLSIDDFRVYKLSGGNYPSPWDLAATALNESAELTWADMNASGQEDFQFDNDVFDVNNGIVINGDGDAWAAERFDLAGASTVNSISVHSINDVAVDVTVAAFGQLGTLFGVDPIYSMNVTLEPGWNDFDVTGWDMNNSFLIGYTFSATVTAGVDGSGEGNNSMVLLGGSWDNWSDVAVPNALPNGEWGVRANVSFDGANVTYNVYRDGVYTGTSGGVNAYTDEGLLNNTTYSYAVTAVYSDGEESDYSSSVTVTPQAQTVHEESHDDGTAEAFFNAGSQNFTAVRYGSGIQEDVIRFKWYQESDGGAFYLKMYEDDMGMPGAEVYSRVMAGGLFAGWNTYDLVSEGLTIEGDFWIGTKEFSSTAPVGLDTDSGASGDSYTRIGSTGEWTAVDGNLMIRVFLDCGDNCDSEPQCSPADVNADGLVNVLDIVSTINFVMGLSSPNEAEQCAADLNGDGMINVLDIVAMVNVIVGG